MERSMNNLSSLPNGAHALAVVGGAGNQIARWDSPTGMTAGKTAPALEHRGPDGNFRQERPGLLRTTLRRSSTEGRACDTSTRQAGEIPARRQLESVTRPVATKAISAKPVSSPASCASFSGSRFASYGELVDAKATAADECVPCGRGRTVSGSNPPSSPIARWDSPKGASMSWRFATH